MHSCDIDLLKNIQLYFGECGSIIKPHQRAQGPTGRQGQGENSFSAYAFRVFSIKEFHIILDHFEQYPLQSCKYADFIFFKEIILKIKCGEHLTVKGLQDIVNIKANLNRGLSPLLKEAFPKFVPVARASIETSLIPDPYWLAGFAEGESCFTISLNRDSAANTGYIVSLKFELSPDLRDEKLLQNIVNYMGCGKVYCLTTGSFNRGNYLVSKLSDILTKIIPFFLAYPLLGVKSKAFQN